MSITPAVASPYIAEAERLAERLLARAIITSKGLCWPSITAAYSRERIVRQPNITLATGNAGFLVFLCETHRRTGNVDFLEAATRAMDWTEAECAKDNQGLRSLWFGQLGVVEALLALYESTQDECVLEKARLLSIRCGESFFSEDKSLGPIFSSMGAGAAGALLTLLRVFEKTQDEQLLEISQRLVRLLVSRARLAPKGIYWDRMGDTIRPPIGFISGTSGVLYALAEANKVLPFEACSWLLNQGKLYENSFLNDSTSNWPDLSYSSWSIEDLGNLPKKIRNALKKGKDQFFTEFGDSASWSSGCSGIALARAASSSLLGESSCLSDIERANARIEQEVDRCSTGSEEIDFSLIGGLGGVGVACLGLRSRTGDNSYRDLAEEIGGAVLRQRRNLGFYRSNLKAIEDGEDMGFLTGSTGIGYFLLKLSDEYAESSLLAPALGLGDDPYRGGERDGSIPQRGVYQVLSSVFPRTVNVLKKEKSIELQLFVAKLDDDSAVISEFDRFCRTYNSLEQVDEGDALFSETYRIEKARQELDFCPQGDRYLGLKLSYDSSNNRKAIEELSEKKLLSKKLVLVPEARILESPYRWSRNETGDFESDKIVTYYLHHQRPTGVFEVALPEFNYLVLSSFRKKVKLNYALKKIVSQFSPQSEEERDKIIKICIEQIKEAMRNGLLCV